MPDKLVTTDGRETYEVTLDWALFPQDLPRGRLSQLAVLPDGRVAICQRADPAIVLFDASGRFERAWHHAALASVHGLAATMTGDLWVTSFDLHQVLRFSSDGVLLQELGHRSRPGWGVPFNHPTDMAVAGDGELYVTDGYGNTRVHRFAADGRLLGSWGTAGRGEGQFTCPHGIWVDDARARVIVLDRDNDRICLFDREGRWIETWDGFARAPMDVWGDGERLWISDQTPAIWCVDAVSGAVIGRSRGFCVYPHGIWGEPGGFFTANQQPDGVARYRRVRSYQ
jgi:DNA-binding beta-propeller fold protein YncE